MTAQHDNARHGGGGHAAVPAGEPEAPVAPAPGGHTNPPERPGTPPDQPDRSGDQPAGAPAEPGQTPESPQPAGEPEAPTGPAPTPSEQRSAGHAAGPSGAGGEPGDHERRLELDLEELTAKAEKADEYLELAKRTKADFENYRKRAAREAAIAQERGIAKLAKELLPAVDNLDRAVQAAEAAAETGATAPTADSNGTSTLVDGIKLVHADVLAALQRAGIERYSPRGEPFDPQHHEAIAQQPVEGAQPGTIVEVYQQGYRLGEAVIRPARVVVAG